MNRAIFLDVDGVILNFAAPLADYWNEGLKLNKWKGTPISGNPTSWSFGLDPMKDDMSELNRAIDIFHEDHEHLPLMHDNICEVLCELSNNYHIELVSSYPDLNKRIDNLLHHDIPYDKLNCNINDKLGFIQSTNKEVVAIFEDGPHHIIKYLPHYPGKIWAPNNWEYLKPFKSDDRIIFYDDPSEWIRLNDPDK